MDGIILSLRACFGAEVQSDSDCCNSSLLFCSSVCTDLNAVFVGGRKRERRDPVRKAHLDRSRKARNYRRLGRC